MSYDYIVKSGDNLSVIASKHGLTIDDIYNHPANSTFRQLHPDKGLIQQGDVIYIPAPDPTSQTTLLATNQSAARIFNSFSECGKPSKPCPCNLVAEAKKKPTTTEVQEIQGYLDTFQAESQKSEEKLRKAGLSNTLLENKLRLIDETLAHDAIAIVNANTAIRKTIEYYDISDSNITSIRFGPNITVDADTSRSGNIRMGNRPLTKGPSFLASTIIHETTHANQAEFARRTGVGWENDSSKPLFSFEEAWGYYSALKSAKNTGLDQNSSDYKWYEEQLEYYFNQLNATELTKFMNGNCQP